MNPWEQICTGVDAGMVEAQRQVLESTQLDAMKHWESTRESFVALVQRLRDEVVGTRPPKYLGESAIWGDSTVSLAVDDEDPLLRRAALSWALAEVLVDPVDATLAKKAIRCMKQHGSNYERSHGAEHAVAFEALLQVVPNSSKVRRCVWAFLADHALDIVSAGDVGAEEVRRVLALGCQGRTETIVAPVLQALADAPSVDGHS